MINESHGTRLLRSNHLMSIVINSLSPVCGAEVIGLDANAVSDADFAAVHRAFIDHGVLCFRDQRLSPEGHEAFSSRFGRLMGHILAQYLLPGHSKILVLSNRVVDGKPVGLEDAGRYWHSDVSYEPVPPLGSMLYGMEVPPEGGDTLFASQYAAYEALPEALKRRIAGLKARHAFNYDYIQSQAGSKRRPLSEEQKAKLKGAVHPVVRTHPESGRKALYVSPAFTAAIEGMEKAESDALLQELAAYATAESVIYRHRWRQFDLVLWDNRCLMHHATTYPPQYIRHMHRTTIEGSVPF
jgi:taurine dioxygenase